MILKLYKSNISLGLLLLPVLIIIICLPVLFNQHLSINYAYVWQSNIFGSYILSNILNFTLSVILIGLNTYSISKVINRSHIFSKQSFLPSIIYLIILSSNESFISPVFLVVNFLLIILSGLLIRFDHELDSVHLVFKSALIVGLLIDYSYEYALLFFVLIIYLLVFRKVRLRDILALIIGVSIPIVYVLCLQYLILNEIDLSFNLTHYSVELNMYDKVKIGLFVLLLVMVFQRLKGFYLANTSTVKKQLYMVNSIFFVTLISAVFLFVFFRQLDSLLLIPFVILSSVSALIPKNDTIISILLTIVLIVNIVTLYLR